MTLWAGGYTVYADQSWSVVPVMLSGPSAVSSDGLMFDVSGLRSAATSQPFGYLRGLTVDASNANLGVAALSFFFPELGLTRTVNTGTVAVLQVPGTASRVTLKIQAGGWTSGGIQLTLWNTQPATEVSSPIGVSISGPVTISGTPTLT
jgi:hypothetical protein